MSWNDRARGRAGLRCVWLLCVVAWALPGAVAAQGTIEDYRRAERFLMPNRQGLVLNGNVTPEWIRGTDRFWYRRELPGGKEFVLVDPAANVARPAFDHGRLAESLSRAVGREIRPEALPFDRFEFSGSGDAIEATFEGSRWRCDLSTYACEKQPPRPERPRAVSPDGRWQAVVRDHDLYLRNTESGWEVRLTEDGAPDRAYATPLPSPMAMIRERTEQPDQPPAVFWAPDSKRLITYRLDARGVGRLSMVQHAPPDRIRPYFYTYAYPLPEDTVLPTVEPVIFEVGTWRRIPAKMEPIVRQYYGGMGFRWSEDGSRAFVQVVDRGYTRGGIVAIDGRTGDVTAVVDEKGEPYFDMYSRPAPYYLDGSDEVLWPSERDGWMHLYLYDTRTGRLKNRVTQGEWVVRGVVHVDARRRVVYFLASGREPGRDPYLQHLYRIGLDGSGLRLLTPEHGEHAVWFSPTGEYFVDRYSLPDTPPITVLRRASDGAVIRVLERANIDRLLATGWKPPEPFRAVARDGKTDIYGILWRPSTFDPGKRYPVIEQVYTGPHNFFVPKSFDAWSNHAQAIAELGFIVVQIDGMGTAKRSRAFHEVSWKNLGDDGLPDRVGAIRQLAAERPWMDTTRVGVYGHSAGGYDAVRSMLMYPDFYKVGVSSAGNHDHRLDKAVWNTQWMGWPVGEHYEEQSNVTQAHRLKGKLLLVHGDVDENVPVSATLRLVDALIRANKDFEMLIMPNQYHGLGGHPYFIKKRWDFFVRHLLGVEPPAEFRIGERERVAN